MDIFGFKRRKVRRQLNERFDSRERKQLQRNANRLKLWMNEGRQKGTRLIQSYMENKGIPAPRNEKQCKELIEALNDVES